MVRPPVGPGGAEVEDIDDTDVDVELSVELEDNIELEVRLEVVEEEEVVGVDGEVLEIVDVLDDVELIGVGADVDVEELGSGSPLQYPKPVLHPSPQKAAPSPHQK